MQPLNLVRLGLATANSKGLLHTPKFNVNYTLKSMTEIERLFRLVDEGIPIRPYGVWKGLVLVFGRDVADRLADEGECAAMNLPPTVASTPKRNRTIVELETNSSVIDLTDSDDDAHANQHPSSSGYTHQSASGSTSHSSARYPYVSGYTTPAPSRFRSTIRRDRSLGFAAMSQGIGQSPTGEPSGDTPPTTPGSSPSKRPRMIDLSRF